MSNVDFKMIRPGLEPAADAVGVTLFANIDEQAFPTGIMIATGYRKSIPTGLKVSVVADHYLETVSFPELAAKGVIVLGKALPSFGSEELMILLLNTSAGFVRILNGQPIARLMMHKIIPIYHSVSYSPPE